MNVFTSSFKQRKLVSLSRQTCIMAPAEGDADATAPPEVHLNLRHAVNPNRISPVNAFGSFFLMKDFKILLRLFDFPWRPVSAATSPY